MTAQKVIAVMTTMGRCGSSMVMGLLAEHGAKIGIKAHPFNEISELLILRSRMYGDDMLRWTQLGFEHHEKMLEKHRSALKALLTRHLGAAETVALKTPLGFPLGLFDPAALFVINMHRKPEAQIESMFKFSCGNESKVSINTRLVDRTEYMKRFCAHYRYNYFDFDFDAFQTDPMGIGQQLAEWCGLPFKAAAVTRKYQPRLVHH